MVLTVYERERWMIVVAARLAEERTKRGLPLNLAEAAALITSSVLAGAREGRADDDLIRTARRVVCRADVTSGVPERLEQLRVEATFPDGARLVTITRPIRDDAPEVGSAVRPQQPTDKAQTPGSHRRRTTTRPVGAAGACWSARRRR